jgi:hypothetical protein
MTPTERPTAASYREMAECIGTPRIHADMDGFASVDVAFLERAAHALRCAAEDAERAQEMRAWMQLIYDYDDGAWAAGKHAKEAREQGIETVRGFAGRALRGEPVSILGGTDR